MENTHCCCFNVCTYYIYIYIYVYEVYVLICEKFHSFHETIDTYESSFFSTGSSSSSSELDSEPDLNIEKLLGKRRGRERGVVLNTGFTDGQRSPSTSFTPSIT